MSVVLKCNLKQKLQSKYGYDYWGCERKYRYGGYHYDGGLKSVAEEIVNHYHLHPEQKVLDNIIYESKFGF